MSEILYQIIKFDDDLNEKVISETDDKTRAYEIFSNPDENGVWHRCDVWMKQIEVHDDSWDVTYIGRGYDTSNFNQVISRDKGFVEYPALDKAYEIANRIVEDHVGHVGWTNDMYIVGDDITGSAIITTSWSSVDEWLDRTWQNGFDQEYVKDAVESLKKDLFSFGNPDEYIEDADDFLHMVYSEFQYTNLEEEFSEAFEKIQKTFAEKRQCSSLRSEGTRCAHASEQIYQDKNNANRHRSSEKDR